MSPAVFWDTPDFDSLAAAEYRRGVLETAALADLYLLVLSKEKYSDLSVWNMLKLLSPLGRPLIICLNKSTPMRRTPCCGPYASVWLSTGRAGAMYRYVRWSTGRSWRPSRPNRRWAVAT